MRAGRIVTLVVAVVGLAGVLLVWLPHHRSEQEAERYRREVEADLRQDAAAFGERLLTAAGAGPVDGEVLRKLAEGLDVTYSTGREAGTRVEFSYELTRPVGGALAFAPGSVALCYRETVHREAGRVVGSPVEIPCTELGAPLRPGESVRLPAG
ncbi:hypothetical protein ACIRBX_13880 [Kitasatospora sp. NPDC096147]|uniref:hypothetical protein n=1 Tax=Kitasatospora sp. NPDC096147 TaxID=3364093 RepID=UPI0038189665